MVRDLTEEEKELQIIFEPLIDPQTQTLKEDAPPEAKKALEKSREIANRIRYEAMFG